MKETGIILLSGMMAILLAGCETAPPEIVIIYPPDIGGTVADLGDNVSFEHHVKPLLATHCLGCHGDDNEETPFSLASYESFTEANGQHQLVIPGEPERSGLFLVTVIPDHYVESMPADAPLGHKLEEEDVWTLYTWILHDGEWPKGEAGRLVSN
ncbi:MAG: c-type cytochrome domain-containing protein [Verrucomicrobiota bacterium]